MDQINHGGLYILKLHLQNYLLLLFYRDLASSGGTKVPIATLSAVFSHVYRGARNGQNTTDGTPAHALDSNFNS